MAHFNYGPWCLLWFLSMLLVANSQTTETVSNTVNGNTVATTPPMTVSQTNSVTAVNGNITAAITPPMTASQTNSVTDMIPTTVPFPEPTTASQMTRPLINTTTGMISGFTKTVSLPDGLTMLDSYLGIPYAASPTGDLRFAKPQPRESWTDTFEALQYGSACPQGDPQMAAGLVEDCLSLNVFVPRLTDTEPLPIMVWIHGGGFSSGSSSITPGDILATFGKVIVVTVNYRLGVFGFLSTSDDCARGNWGLWDQRLALQWVKYNADRFGGDANKITLIGNSAGGNSVLYHVLSPLNGGLFQRAISQSPVEFNAASLDDSTATSAAELLGKNLGFDQTDDPNLLLQYLRQNKTMAEIYAGSLTVPVGFQPVIDGELIRKSDTFDTSTAINDFDLLLGVNKGDASAYYFDGVNSLTKEQFIAYVQRFVDAFCRGHGECKGRDVAVEAVTFAYNDLQDLNKDDVTNLVRAMEVVYDAAFESHASNIAQLHSSQSGSSNTYVYQFTYNDTEFYRPDVPRDVIPNPLHVEELFYVFGAAILNPTSSMEKIAMSYKFMSYWTNFARNGDPNVGNMEFIDVSWPKFDTETQSYLILEPNSSVGENFAADSYAFWYKYIQNLIEESDEEDLRSCPLDAPIPVWESIPPTELKTFEIKDKDDNVLGWINGTLVHVSDVIGASEINVIRGIPYAKPPLGSLRFSPPSPVEPWNGTLSGTRAPECPNAAAWKNNIDWNEDCLSLDIAAVNGADSPLPVIVFIMGIDFQNGGQIPSSEMLASGTNSTVVTFRYRVGAFGFISTGQSSASGNYGLLDTIAVLKWVKNYIGSFGGDPNQVTLMGYGTGASIVNIMLLSKRSDGLFQRVVSLSEVSFTRILHTSREVKNNPLASAVKLGEIVGCSYESADQLITCLQSENVTASDILAAASSPMSPILFFPVVDNDVLTDSIDNLRQNTSNIKSVDHLIGVTEDPGAFRLMRANGPQMAQQDTCITEEVWREHLNFFINGHLIDNGPITRTVAAEYLEIVPSESEDNPCPLLRRAVDFLNDFFFLVPTLYQAKAHTETGGNVYVYKFQQKPKYLSQHTKGTLPPWIGASFGDDIQYLFGLPYSTNSPGCYGTEDRQTSLVLMKMMRHFVTSGDPSTSLSSAEWPQFETATRQYLEVDACPKVPDSGLVESRLRFWTEIIPLLESPTSYRPAPPPGKEKKCIVGEGIGLNLSTESAATLIEVLIGFIIGLGILILFICGACCGLKQQLKTNKSSSYEIEPLPGGGWMANDEESPHL